MAQLSQVFFSNPAGLTAGTYRGRLLATGELVPGNPVAIMATRQSQGLVLQWPAQFQLQTTTNVMGPWMDLFVSSPYTVAFTDPQRYFRLRSQWNFFPQDQGEASFLLANWPRR